jgi:His/Glu/Gln/Arg/opine family amino acid ABC transporter permease subunit
MKRWRGVLSVPVVGVAIAGLLWLPYRAYAPGDLGDRFARAQARWDIFTAASTWTFLGRGLVITLELALLSIGLSLIFAVVLALVRLAPHPRMQAPVPGAAIASRASAVLVEVVRSSPLFMLIIYTFIGLPRLGVDLSPFWAGVGALTLYTSAVTSEIVRAGILSLERGQFEAAMALGLGYTQRIRFVVLPQGLRRMVPAIVSQLMTLIKDTSLVSFITVFELARRGQALQQLANNPIETSLVLMAIYFVVNLSLSQLARRLEMRPGRVGRAQPSAALGAEDQIPVAEAIRP